MRVIGALFGIVAVLALVAFLFIAVSAKNSESCSCYFTGDCFFDENGKGYRYHQCGGSCTAYSGPAPYPACQNPDYKPRKLFD
jgi:hypothetical protein